MSAPALTTYPRRNADGELVWACCESAIGPVCQHRAETEDELDRYRYPTDEQLCILREDYRRAGQLVTLAALERAEYQARILLDRALDILAAIPDGEMDDDDQAWGSEMYMAWATAAVALGKARRENGMGA